MIATPANMRKVEHVRGVFAYDAFNDARYSATPGDYFMLGEDEPVTDGGGEPLILVREICRIEEVEAPPDA
jgi:hypothetical protein